MSRIPPMILRASALFAVVLLAACATAGGGSSKDPDVLLGLVLDPEGRAVTFAKVSVVAQGAVDPDKTRRNFEPPPEQSRGLAVTTETGRWGVEAVSDELGEYSGLPREWYYEVTVYKAGYHVWKDAVRYEKGTLQVDVTLYPDTINIEDIGSVVDTSIGETNTGTGVLRQGQ